MRLIDADALEKRIREMCPAPSQSDYTGDYDEYVQVAQEMVVDVLEAINSAPIISSPLNAPLTLDELREMDGDPVWVAFLERSEESRWYLIDGYNQERLIFSGAYGAYVRWDEMGKTWLAYHRRPENPTQGDQNTQTDQS